MNPELPEGYLSVKQPAITLPSQSVASVWEFGTCASKILFLFFFLKKETDEGRDLKGRDLFHVYTSNEKENGANKDFFETYKS